MSSVALLALSDKATVELIDAIPGLLWIAFAAFVVFFFRHQLRALLPRVQSVKVGIFEAKLHAAIDEASKSRNIPLSSSQRSRVTRRAAREADLLRSARILWIDDNHTSTAAERRALDALDVEVITADDNAEALKRLGEGSFDLLLSDIDRAGDNQAGISFAQYLRDHHHGLPIIFYIRKVDPNRQLPLNAFGLTNRPDELLHLVMDALARQRG